MKVAHMMKIINSKKLVSTLLYCYSLITVKNFVTMYAAFDPCNRGILRL